MCTCGLLISLMFPFRLAPLNVVIRAVIIFGLAATLSRAGILACLIALMVYGIMLGRWTAVLRTIVITILLGVVAFLALEPLKQSHIEGVAARAANIQKMLQGGVQGQTLQGRWYLWSQGFRHAAPHGLLGRGHGSMNYAVKLFYLEHEGRWHAVGPHNYYIFVWGNSGLIGLVGLFLFFGYLASIALKSQVRRVRAGLIALLIVFALLACADHAVFAFQFFGAIFAMYALAGHYTRRPKSARPRALPPERGAMGYMPT
jgi:O-antigen ligase